MEALWSVLTGLYLQLLLHHGHRRRLFVLKVNCSKNIYSHTFQRLFLLFYSYHFVFLFCVFYLTLPYLTSPHLTLPHLTSPYLTSPLISPSPSLHLHCISFILYLFISTPHFFLINLYYIGGDDLGI